MRSAASIFSGSRLVRRLALLGGSARCNRAGRLLRGADQPGLTFGVSVSVCNSAASRAAAVERDLHGAAVSGE